MRTGSGLARSRSRRSVSHRTAMALVSRPASAIDSALVCGVCEDHAERLPYLVALLQENPLPFIPSEMLQGEGVSVQRVHRTHKRASVDEADLLEPEERSLCAAIEDSEDVAMPREQSLAPEVRASHDGSVLTLRLVENCGQSNEHPLSGALRVEATMAGEKATLCASDQSIIEELFLLAPGPALPAFDPERKTWPRGAVQGTLPYWLTEDIAHVLQCVYRFHVLCSAAAPEARPVVLDRARLFQDRKSDDEKWWRTFVSASFHASSASCVCAAHSRPLRRGKLRMTFGFCGRALVQGACPTHPLYEGQGEHVCTANMSVGFLCKHDGPPEGIKLHLPINGSIGLSPLMRIAEAAMLVVNDPSRENEARRAVDEAIQRAESQRQDTRPPQDEADDLRALHLLRSHSAIRKKSGKLARIRGETESSISALSASYGHLFPAHPAS